MEKHAKKLMKSAKSNLAKAKRSYTCRSLKDLVRAYRACTTAAEERALVKKESAHIRDLFREGDKAFRRQNISKLLFFHMNGYPTSFGMTECIKLCASPKYADKRVAYLGLMILVDETAEILMLMTNCLKQDLCSFDRSIASLALSVLGDIASADMMRDLLPEISGLLVATDPHLRKKALLAAVRATRKLERDELDDVIDTLPQALDSTSPAVLCSGAALVTQIVNRFPAEKAAMAEIAFAPLCAALRQLLLSGARAADTTVSGVRSPFLTVKLLAALRTVAMPPHAEALAGLVQQVASNTAHTHVIGCAVLYECVRCAVAIPQDATLRATTIQVLGNFLAHKLASVRYVALQELVKVCKLPEVGRHVAEYRDTILSCLSESDTTISKMAVELVYAITTESDAPEMCAHLLKYLDGDRPIHHIEETCQKLFDLLSRYGASSEFKVEMFVKALQKVDLAMPEQLVTAFAAMISTDPLAQKHAVTVLFREALAPTPTTPASPSTTDKTGNIETKKRRKPRLERVALYTVGEYGDILMNTVEDAHKHKVIDAIERSLKKSPVAEPSWISSQTPQYISEVNRIRETSLCALAKLAARIDSHGGPMPNTASETTKALDGGLGSLAAIMPPAATPKQEISGFASDVLAGLGISDTAVETKAVVPVEMSREVMLVNGEESSESSGDILLRIRGIIAKYRKSSDLETQQLACEYSNLLTAEMAQLRNIALARMPPIDLEEIKRKMALRQETMQMQDEYGSTSAASKPFNNDLLSLIEDNNYDNSSSAPKQIGGSGMDDLLAIAYGNNDSTAKSTTGVNINNSNSNNNNAGNNNDLNGLLGLPAPPATNNTGSGGLGLDELMGEGPAKQKEPSGAGALGLDKLYNKGPAVENNNKKTTPVEILTAQVGNLGVGVVNAGPVRIGETSWSPTADIRAHLEFLRDHNDRAVTHILATFTNLGTDSYPQFNFGLAVPNGMAIEMLKASSDSLTKEKEVKQTTIVTNPMHETKNIRLMFRIQFRKSIPGAEMTTIKGKVPDLPKNL